MKYTGAILLWIAFTMAGMKTSLLLKRRVAILDETVIFLNLLIGEIEYAKTGITRILSTLSVEKTVKNLSFLKEFTNYDNTADFRKKWKESILLFPYYKSDEKEKMLQLGAFLGTTDAVNQVNTIKLYQSYFRDYRRGAFSDHEKYGKLSVMFGLFIGASVFILMI